MEPNWMVPVSLVVAGAAYAILARYFAHRERLARIRSGESETTTTPRSRA